MRQTGQKSTVTGALLSAMLALSGCATNSSAVEHYKPDEQRRQQVFAASDKLIVPGRRIGPISLGMGMDEVVGKLGKPDLNIAGGQYPGGAHYGPEFRYWSLNLAIVFDASAAPAVVSVQNVKWRDAALLAVFKTADGVGIGSTSFEVKRVFGTPSQDASEVMWYRSRGVFFEFTGYDVRKVTVSAPQ